MLLFMKHCATIRAALPRTDDMDGRRCTRGCTLPPHCPDIFFRYLIPEKIFARKFHANIRLFLRWFAYPAKPQYQK